VNLARRRIQFCVIAGGLIAASPNVSAQRPERVARLGVLETTHCEPSSAMDALRDGLRNAGWVEGRNVHIDCSGAGGQIDRLPALARELVDRKPDLIVAISPQPSRAAKSATSTIPIVFIAVADPVRFGLVESLAHPGGNVTGLATAVPGGLMAKALDTLKQAVPQATRIATLVNPSNEMAAAFVSVDAPPAARQLGVTLQVLEARTPEEIERAIDIAVQQKAEALWVIGDPVLLNPPQRIPDLAARARLPAMYMFRDHVLAGGLMSYGPDVDELFRRGATYIDKILKGAKPADLPVEQPTRLFLVINLKTAKALGIAMPQLLLLRADEVIE